MRNINRELGKLFTIRRPAKTFLRCNECGKRIPNNQNKLQRHYLEHHKIDDHINKKEKGWRFNPAKPRADNPMDLKNILG